MNDENNNDDYEKLQSMDDSKKSKEQNDQTDQNGISKAKDTIEDSQRAVQKGVKTASKIGSAIVNVISFIIANWAAILIAIGVGIAIGLIVTVGKYLLDWFASQDMPELTYKAMGVSDFSELVTIQGNEEEGYHLEFVEDFEERLDQAVDKLNESNLTINIEDKELLRKFVIAEVSTQYPNLMGDEVTRNRCK